MALIENGTLRADLVLGEAPRWHDERLYVSDMYAEEVIAIDLAGNRETVVAVPGQPSGTGWLPSGDMLVVSMLDATVMRFDGHSLTTVAEFSEMSAALNDMVVSPDGRAYVGGMPDLHALQEPGTDPTRVELPAEHLYLVAEAESDARAAHHVVATDLHFPNGAVITSDGRELIVAETYGKRLSAFRLDATGAPTDRRVWTELDCMPDGICLDAEGCVWVAAPEPAEARGFWRVAAGGEVKQRIPTDRHAVAVALGGPQRDHLFMMEATSMTVDTTSTARARGNGRVQVTRVDVPGAGSP